MKYLLSRTGYTRVCNELGVDSHSLLVASTLIYVANRIFRAVYPWKRASVKQTSCSKKTLSRQAVENNKLSCLSTYT